MNFAIGRARNKVNDCFFTEPAALADYRRKSRLCRG